MNQRLSELSSKQNEHARLDHRQVLSRAWPFVLGGLSTPLLGLVDSAVIGNLGTASELGSVALGSLIFNFVFWSFGFLRMSTTGFVAQAWGRGSASEVQAVLAQALVVAAGASVLILALSPLIEPVALGLLGASGEVEALTRDYFWTRLWGAPAALAGYALLGVLIGLGRSREVLAVQVVTNGANIALDLLLAGPLELGVRGIALGTALSEWLGMVMMAALVLRRALPELGGSGRLWFRGAVRWRALFHTLRTNGFIMARTLCLLAGFAWMTRKGAGLGEEVLAANHLLLGLISLCAFFLDGFAYVVEAEVGRAHGAGDPAAFDRSIRVTTEVSVVFAAALGLLLWVLGPWLLGALTALDSVRASARSSLPWAALYVVSSAAAFQLDGIFIGVTAAGRMFLASAASLLGFVLISAVLTARWGSHGLWGAFIAFVVLRALTLAAFLAALRRQVKGRVSGAAL